ncbi:hypothetical protein ILUMI_00793 [Ignelater luminosus]|uniref:RecQ-mediated genome instability protein 1 n=1 Tax=Ignelater luminosus TaxID=2038154 RepID=A0A8K0DFK3_IGNLU|nr:hypothetical protein ILUMI_00793 [Ignelater luminosus]
MDEEILSTKRFFQSQHITLSDFWLESCIQWYHEENPGLNYTRETLHLKVYQQWLLLDLRDVEIPILPANLTQQKKVMLNGIYSLQMLYIIDISRSKFYQIQKLRNSNALINAMADQEAQTLNHGKRVLQLRLTDGVQEIEAIEYKPISTLNVNLPPGTKIRITGPIIVRRGQMMLEERHINVLGGEVEELLVSNAAENILANALDLPLNLNPNIINEDSVPDSSNVLRNAPNVASNNQQLISNSNSWNMNIVDRNNISRQTSSINRKDNSSTMTSKNVSVKDKINPDFISEEDELRILEEVDMLLETERDMNIDLPGVCEDNSLNTDAVLKIDGPNSKPCDNIKNISSDTDKSIFEDMDIDAHLDIIDEQVQQTNQSTNKKQIGIGELLSNNITCGKFTIRAKFKSVTQKLTVTDDVWSLRLLITDDKNDMEVSVHSDVMSDVMGYYPAAVMALKKDILNKDENATTTVMKMLEELKVKIMHLDCDMEITYAPNQLYPTITKLK